MGAQFSGKIGILREQLFPSNFRLFQMTPTFWQAQGMRPVWQTCKVALFPSSLVGNLKRKAQKFDCSVHVSRLPQVNADPATLGKDVVRFGPTSYNQLIADSLRKGNFHQAVAMYVADFTPPQAIFRTSKAMWLRCDPWPVLQGGMDFFFRSGNTHSSSPDHPI